MNKEMLLSLLETNARYSTKDLADVLLEDDESGVAKAIYEKLL